MHSYTLHTDNSCFRFWVPVLLPTQTRPSGKFCPEESHTLPEHTDTSPQVSQRSELSHSAAAGAAGSCRPACTCQPTTAERRAQRTAQLQYPRGKGVISPRHGSDKPGPGRPDPQSRLRVIVQNFSCTRLAVLLPRVRTRAVREAKGKYNKRGALLPKPAGGDSVDSVLTLHAPPRSGFGGHRMDPPKARPGLGRRFLFYGRRSISVLVPWMIFFLRFAQKWAPVILLHAPVCPPLVCDNFFC